MIVKKYFIILFIISLVSCSSDQTSSVTQDVDQINPDSSKVDVDIYKGYEDHDLPLIDVDAVMKVPGKSLVSSGVKVFTSSSGIINVSAGDRFHLEVIEKAGDIEAMKTELKNNPFYSVNFLEEHDDYIIYENILPDGSQKLVHFYKVMNVDATPITIKSSSEGVFKKGHVDRMLKAANSIRVR